MVYGLPTFNAAPSVTTTLEDCAQTAEERPAHREAKLKKRYIDTNVVYTEYEPWGPLVVLIPRQTVTWLEDGRYAPLNEPGKTRLKKWWVDVINMAKACGAVPTTFAGPKMVTEEGTRNVGYDPTKTSHATTLDLNVTVLPNVYKDMLCE